MAAEDKKNSHGDTCMCPGCRGGMGIMGMGAGRHWTFFLLRTLITILILMIVFWFGVSIGRMNGGYAHTRFMMNGGAGMYGSGGAPMPMMPMNGTTTAQ